MSQVRIVKRNLMAMPGPRSPDAAPLAALEGSAHLLQRMHTQALIDQLHRASGSRRMPQNALPVALHGLWHELSPRAMAHSAMDRFEVARSSTEQAICEQVIAPLTVALADENTTMFIELIESIGCSVSAVNSGFRRNSVFLDTDTRGIRVQFPASRHIRSRLRELHAYLRIHLHRQPVFSALAAMAGLVNCHPFRDGNGRCSRILFNALLRVSNVLGNGYLPLYELFWRSGCGWEIRLRYTELTNDWNLICDYLRDLIRAGHTLTLRELAVAESS